MEHPFFHHSERWLDEDLPEALSIAPGDRLQMYFHDAITLDYIEFEAVHGDYDGSFEEYYDFFSALTLDGQRTTSSINFGLTDLTLVADGATPETPLLPDDDSPVDSFEFTFDAPEPGELVFIDPFVSVGYDYEMLSGPNFASVMLPTGFGDNLFDLWLYDLVLNDFVDTGIDLTGGVQYDFTPGGVNLFRIMGIETFEMLDPNDPNAFVTGLGFVSAGAVNMTQTPLTEFVQDNTSVPTPAAFWMIVSGLAVFGLRRVNS